MHKEQTSTDTNLAITTISAMTMLQTKIPFLRGEEVTKRGPENAELNQTVDLIVVLHSVMRKKDRE